jgi:hypothetical protein
VPPLPGPEHMPTMLTVQFAGVCEPAFVQPKASDSILKKSSAYCGREVAAGDMEIRPVLEAWMRRRLVELA